MNAAKQAIADGRGLQFIAQLIEEKCGSGLSQRQAVYEIVRHLELYQKQDEVTALALIKYLRQWMYIKSVVDRPVGNNFPDEHP